MSTQPDLPTLGVEEELALVDVADHQLAGRAQEVLAELPELVRPWVDHELKTCQIEAVSPVCSTLAELRDALGSLRANVARTAERLGCAVLAGGTHPSGGWRSQELTDTPAYQRLETDYRRLADEQLVFGCHVHVGVADPDRRIAALDRVRPWLATLLALSANSPFWEGRDTGYASYRYLVFSRWPTFCTPDQLGSWAGYQALVDELVANGSIDSPKRLYWTVRPSGAYPTLEFRITDVCTTVDEAVMVAGLCRALVVTALDEVERGEAPPEVRNEVLRLAEWQAARHGLRDQLLDPIGGGTRPAADAVGELLDHVAAALEQAGDTDAVVPVVQRLLGEGEGARRQRAAHRRAGMGAVLDGLRLREGGSVRLAELAGGLGGLGGPSGLDQPLEQAQVRQAVPQQLGVPLDPDQGAVVRLDRLDRAVVGPADDAQASAELID